MANRVGERKLIEMSFAKPTQIGHEKNITLINEESLGMNIVKKLIVLRRGFSRIKPDISLFS